ncbi:hypothetical protein [Pseudomonas sp. S1_E04]
MLDQPLIAHQLRHIHQELGSVGGIAIEAPLAISNGIADLTGPAASRRDNAS